MANKLSLSLRKLVDFWVTKLRLQDWKLDYAVGGPEQGFNDDKIQALVSFAAEMKEATVYLRRLEKPDKALEEDLVHELLHLVFIQYSVYMRSKENDAEQLMAEQAINITANALVDLRK